MRIRLNPIVSITLGLAAAGTSSSLAQAPERVMQGSTTVVGNADSVFRRLVALLETERCTLRDVDHAARIVDAACPVPEPEAVRFRVQSKGDSATISAQGARGGVAAMIVGMSVIQRLMRPVPPGGPRRMPDGVAWPQDAAGRVGFLTLTDAGRRFTRLEQADTAFEVRPQELPPALRADWEKDINDVGFDASCARVFRARDLFLLRWNKCSTPDPEYDRLGLYDADGSWRGSMIGPTIADQVSLTCPAVRPTPHSGRDERCPVPLQ